MDFIFKLLPCLITVSSVIFLAVYLRVSFYSQLYNMKKRVNLTDSYINENTKVLLDCLKRLERRVHYLEECCKNIVRDEINQSYSKTLIDAKKDGKW